MPSCKVVMVNVLLLFLAVIILLRCLLDIRSNQWLHSSKNHAVVRFLSLHRTSFTTYLNPDAIALLKKFRALETFIFSKCDGERVAWVSFGASFRSRLSWNVARCLIAVMDTLQELKLLAVTTLSGKVNTFPLIREDFRFLMARETFASKYRYR